MERDSSDEEDDHQTLIHQNETHTPNHSKIASFNISNQYAPPKLQKKHWCFLLAIFVPIFIIVLYFSTPFPNAFTSTIISGSSNGNSELKKDPVRESELRALYLLREQKLAFASLWNTSLALSQSTNSSFVEDVKSAVVKQISLNKEIERLLLYPYRLQNSDSNNSSNNSSSLSDVGLDEFDVNYERCKKVDKVLSNRRTIEWKPNSDKYLFAICLSGQMSNHLICLEKHMFFAALLGRVLVVPSSKFDYQYNRVLDIEHVNKCLGRKVVVTFDEFYEKRKSHLHIDRLICYFSLPTPCYVDDEHIKKLKSLGISIGKIEPVWVEDIKKPNKRTVQDVEAKFASNENVIAIGDVFYADVEQEWVMQPGGPIAHKCKTLIEPSRLIMLTAQRFVQTFLGKDFIALHFRRHGFLKFCNAKEPSCFFPIPQAAECIGRVVERAYSPVIYLSTDAAESETSLLQSLIVVNGKVVPLVKRPARNSAEKWDALLYRHGLQEDSQVEAMLDKTICAMSSVFIGSSGSTFTDDILRLRKDWGSASLCDEYLCQGELPNFIAEDE